MTNPPEPPAQRHPERPDVHSALATACGRALSAAGRSASAASNPGADAAQLAVPVKLIWHDSVTGEELTVQLEASPELIDGLKQEGFAPESQRDASDTAAA